MSCSFQFVHDEAVGYSSRNFKKFGLQPAVEKDCAATALLRGWQCSVFFVIRLQAARRCDGRREKKQKVARVKRFRTIKGDSQRRTSKGPAVFGRNPQAPNQRTPFETKSTFETQLHDEKTRQKTVIASQHDASQNEMESSYPADVDKVRADLHSLHAEVKKNSFSIISRKKAKESELHQ